MKKFSLGDIISGTVYFNNSARAALKDVDKLLINADFIMRELDYNEEDEATFYEMVNKGGISKVADLKPKDGFIAALTTASELFSVSKREVFEKFVPALDTFVKRCKIQERDRNQNELTLKSVVEGWCKLSHLPEKNQAKTIFTALSPTSQTLCRFLGMTRDDFTENNLLFKSVYVVDVIHYGKDKTKKFWKTHINELRDLAKHFEKEKEKDYDWWRREEKTEANSYGVCRMMSPTAKTDFGSPESFELIKKDPNHEDLKRYCTTCIVRSVSKVTPWVHKPCNTLPFLKK